MRGPGRPAPSARGSRLGLPAAGGRSGLSGLRRPLVSRAVEPGSGRGSEGGGDCRASQPGGAPTRGAAWRGRRGSAGCGRCYSAPAAAAGAPRPPVSAAAGPGRRPRGAAGVAAERGRGAAAREGAFTSRRSVLGDRSLRRPVRVGGGRERRGISRSRAAAAGGGGAGRRLAASLPSRRREEPGSSGPRRGREACPRCRRAAGRDPAGHPGGDEGAGRRRGRRPRSGQAGNRPGAPCLGPRRSSAGVELKGAPEDRRPRRIRDVRATASSGV